MSLAVILAPEFRALIRMAYHDLSTAGIAADWLEERSDPRGKLLRTRWKRWQTEREKAEKADADYRAGVVGRVKAAMKVVIRMGGRATVQVETSYVKDADERFRFYLSREYAATP